jgi:GDP-L-fucose synthase
MFYKGKKVLVTGSGGLVGTQVAKLLLEQGAEVRGTYRNRKVPSWVGELETMKCDFMNIEDVKMAVKGMDIVFVCSANTSGAGVMAHDPLQHVTPNLIMNSTLMEESYRAGVERFFFVSSATTYPPADYPIKEDEVYNGEPYKTYFGVGWMKRYTEILAQFYHRNNLMKMAMVRPANIYGIQGDFSDKTGHVLPALIRRALEKQDPYIVWGNPDVVRDFTHSTDMARACLGVVEKYAVCDPVNIACGNLVTIGESVDLILKSADHNVTPQYDESKPVTIQYRALDTTKARDILGYEPKVSFEDGIQETVDWIREKLGDK